MNGKRYWAEFENSKEGGGDEKIQQEETRVSGGKRDRGI